MTSSPRDQRAIQYFAYPDWKFDRLREQYPGGADIGPDEWITLKLDIDDTRLTASVNGTETLTLSETKGAPGLQASHRGDAAQYLTTQRSTYDRTEAASSAGFVPGTR